MSGSESRDPPPRGTEREQVRDPSWECSSCCRRGGNGTADEQTMLNYFSSTIEPILSAIVDEFKRKFLSKTARTQGQSIMYFREPFKLAPVKNIAEVAEKLITNRVLTSNEVRGVLGYKPAEDAEADKLLNPNIDTMQDAASAEPEPDLTEEQLE